MARSRLSGDRSVRYHDVIYIIRGLGPFAKESGRSIAIRAARPTGVSHEPLGGLNQIHPANHDFTSPPCRRARSFRIIFGSEAPLARSRIPTRSHVDSFRRIARASPVLPKSAGSESGKVGRL